MGKFSLIRMSPPFTKYTTYTVYRTQGREKGGEGGAAISSCSGPISPAATKRGGEEKKKGCYTGIRRSCFGCAFSRMGTLQAKKGGGEKEEGKESRISQKAIEHVQNLDRIRFV